MNLLIIFSMAFNNAFINYFFYDGVKSGDLIDTVFQGRKIPNIDIYKLL